jgi:sRNA-binding carbon storage regulator CsrA
MLILTRRPAETVVIGDSVTRRKHRMPYPRP